MKKKTVAGITIAIIVAVFVAVYLNMKKRQSEVIKELENDDFQLIIDSIHDNNKLSSNIKNTLEELVVEFDTIDRNISGELVKALQLLQIEQTESAIKNLVKIIEHMLKKHYENNDDFKTWLKKEKKKKDLHNLLTFCKIEEKISDIEYRFFIAVKAIRNKETHEINIQLDKYINASGLLTAIGGIIKISKFVYPQKALN